MDGIDQATKPGDPTPVASGYKSKLYDSSIFVMESSQKWRKELAPGYYADYEVEIYLT